MLYLKYKGKKKDEYCSERKMGEEGVKNEGDNKLNTEHDAKILITQSYHVLLLIDSKKKRICALVDARNRI